MDTQASKSSSPLMWVVGIAVLMFCAAGTAALMGWIPLSLSRTADGAAPPAAEKPSAGAAGTASPASAPKPRSSYEPRTAPVLAANAPPVRVKCAECGVVESTREVATRGQGTGLGAVGGAVVGGLLGNQVGNGGGKDIATVVGAVGGGLAGNEIEKRVKTTKSYEVTVHLDDGSSRVIPQAAPPSWRAGDRVRIVDGAIRAN